MSNIVVSKCRRTTVVYILIVMNGESTILFELIKNENVATVTITWTSRSLVGVYPESKVASCSLKIIIRRLSKRRKVSHGIMLTLKIFQAREG